MSLFPIYNPNIRQHCLMDCGERNCYCKIQFRHDVQKRLEKELEENVAVKEINLII